MQLFDNFTKKLSSLKLPVAQNKLLLFAIIASLILHLLLISEFSLSLPELPNVPHIMQARLIEPRTIQPALPIPATNKKSSPKLSAPAEIEPLAQPALPSQNLEENSKTPSLLDTESLSLAPADMGPSPIVNQDSTAELELESTSEDLAVYTHVDTEFEVRRGEDVSAAGTARIIFSINKNGTYSINSTTEAKGLAALFFDPLVQKSEGVVTKNGLQPEFFSYQYGTKKTQTANFSWIDGVILMRSAKGEITEKLLQDTQDLLSFMYQFMFMPPFETLQINITNGKNLRTYTYSFEGDEIITTKLGELKTVHLLKTGDEEEKTELWLSLDYKYLPVKIRKTEKNGRAIEQIITNISITP